MGGMSGGREGALLNAHVHKSMHNFWYAALGLTLGLGLVLGLGLGLHLIEMMLLPLLLLLLLCVSNH